MDGRRIEPQFGQEIFSFSATVDTNHGAQSFSCAIGGGILYGRIAVEAWLPNLQPILKDQSYISTFPLCVHEK
jgi:hypothetical protein